MPRRQFTEEPIIGILKQADAGMKPADLCREHGISDATFYKWRSRYGGMEISDARKLKALEDENRRLKKLLAESMLDASTLKEMLGKTSDAQLAETSCDLGGPGEGLLAAAGLWARRSASEDVSICVKAASR